MASTCTVTPIATEGDFADHTSKLPADCLAVIYFHAPWAEPCKQMGTILSTLASTYPATNPPRTAFFSLDAEEVSEVSEHEPLRKHDNKRTLAERLLPKPRKTGVDEYDLFISFCVRC